MNQQTVDIMGSFIPLLAETITILTVVDNGGSFTFTTKCTWWLSIEQTYIIQGNPYKVESFVINQSIVFVPVGHANIPTVGTFPIAAPEYIHGTLKMAQDEVDGEPDKTILCPFSYLIEIITDRKNDDEESMIERETTLRMIWLNTADFSNWLTDDHYTNVIDPMQQMVDLYIKKLKESGRFTDNIRHDDTPLINVSEQGNQSKAVFDCNLSGIETLIFAEIREDLSCLNKCDC